MSYCDSSNNLCHKAIFTVGALTIVYAMFAFYGLGDVELSRDEGIAAVGAKRVLHFGYPKAWDGQNLFSFEAGHDLSENLIQRRLPWLGFYLGAVGLWLFGENNFGARFYFTLCGVLNLPLLYLVGRRLGLRRLVCIIAILLLGSPASYFIYIRQCYHYSVDVTLSLIGLACYLKIENRWNPILLALCVVGMFHLNHLTPMWFALSLTLWAAWDHKLVLLFKRLEVWAAVVVCLIGTYSWIHWSKVLEFQDALGGWGTFLPHLSRLAFVLSELDMSFPLLVTVPLLIWCGFHSRIDRSLRPLFRLSICASTVFLYFSSYQYAWLRFFLFMFAILVMVWATLLVKLWSSYRRTALMLACVMLGTTLPYHMSHRIIGKLWPAFAKYSMRRAPFPGDMPPMLRGLASGINPILIEVPLELTTPPLTQLGEVINYLNRHAKSGEKIVSLWDSETLQFRTRLITAYQVDPRQTTYSKVKHLPAYITSYRDADWLLLHNMQKRNYGMMELDDLDQNEELLVYFSHSGATLEPIPLHVRERFPNQLPNLWGRTWSTDVGNPTLQLYHVRHP